MEQLRTQNHQETTKITYLKVWRNFNSFLIRLDAMPSTWEHRIALYVAYLVDKGRQSATIKSYISAIKAILAYDNYEVGEQKLLLGSLTRSCRLKNDRIKNRLPIQKGLLEMILFEIERKYDEMGQEYLKLLYQCATMLAYYGLLRISELFGIHAVRAKDVHAAELKEKILIVLYTSKTHNHGSRPQKIRIFKQNKELNTKRGEKFFCPFETTLEFATLRGDYDLESEHFFVFQDGTPVKSAQYRKVLKQCIKQLQLQTKNYSPHSLRIGRATDLMKMGMNIDRIKYIGRWKSNAVFKYIRDC